MPTAARSVGFIGPGQMGFGMVGTLYTISHPSPAAKAHRTDPAALTLVDGPARLRSLVTA